MAPGAEFERTRPDETGGLQSEVRVGMDCCRRTTSRRLPVAVGARGKAGLGQKVGRSCKGNLHRLQAEETQCPTHDLCHRLCCMGGGDGGLGTNDSRS